MLFEKAVEELDGQSVGGQLIVNIDGRNVLVGHNSGGELIEEQSDDAQVLLSMLNVEKPEGKPSKKTAAAAQPDPAPTPDQALGVQTGDPAT